MDFRFWRRKSIRATEFVLEDAKGHERAALRTDGAGNTLLHFRGTDEQTRCYIGVTPNDSPRIGLSYANGDGTIQIETNDQLHTAVIIFSAPHSKAKLVLAMSATGVPAILEYDEEGTPEVIHGLNRVIKDISPPEDEFPDWDSFLRK